MLLFRATRRRRRREALNEFECPKRPNPPKSEPRLPSREDLVAFIANAPGKVGKREIARAFNIQGGDRIWLKQMLKELETDGVVDRRRKGVSKAGQLPPVVARRHRQAATATAS